MPTDGDGDDGHALVPLDGEGDHLGIPASAGNEDGYLCSLLRRLPLESELLVQLADGALVIDPLLTGDVQLLPSTHVVAKVYNRLPETWGKRMDTAAIRDGVATWEHSTPIIYRPPK